MCESVLFLLGIGGTTSIHSEVCQMINHKDVEDEKSYQLNDNYKQYKYTTITGVKYKSKVQTSIHTSIRACVRVYVSTHI